MGEPSILALFHRDADQILAPGSGGHVPRQGGCKTFPLHIGTGYLPTQLPDDGPYESMKDHER